LNTRPPLKALALVLALTCVAAACGDSDDAATGGVGEQSSPTVAATEAGATTTVEDLSDLGGNIFITGSSTVEPISIRVAESFEDVAPGVTVDVEGPGTGDGFLKFCNGEAQISDASRPMKDEEAIICADNGIEHIGLQVAIDGIAVVTSTQNDAVECLSFPDLYALVGPESEGFRNWADAGPIAAELGSSTTFPDAPVTITAPGTESGTYDSFVEIVLKKLAEGRGADDTTRTDYSSSADDNVIVTNVSANATSLGWVGFAFYEENAESLRAISVAEDADGECVEATPETIASGEYPIARPLFIYVNTTTAATDPALVAFVDHYLGYGLDQAVTAADYVALGDDVKAETRSAWESR
jgi:phosphate transport system substrate-binding protein